MSENLAIHGGPRAIAETPAHVSRSAPAAPLVPEEEALVLEALRSGCLTRNGGTMVQRLEAEFAAKLGVEHAVACSSGTASVHLAIAALDLEPGDEVIVPPITDIGSHRARSCGRTPCRCSPMWIPRTLVLDPADVAPQDRPAHARHHGRAPGRAAVRHATRCGDRRAARPGADRGLLAGLLGGVRRQAGGHHRGPGLLQPAAEQAHHLRRRRPDGHLEPGLRAARAAVRR